MILALAAALVLQDPETFTFGNLPGIFKTDESGVAHLRIDWPELTQGQIITVRVEIVENKPFNGGPLDPHPPALTVFSGTYNQVYDIDNHASLLVLANTNFKWANRYTIVTTVVVTYWNGEYYHMFTSYEDCKIYNPFLEP